MPRIERRTFAYIIAGSAIASFATLSPVLIFQLPVAPELFYAAAIAVAIFPPGIAHLLNVMWRRAIDRNMPKLLRQIADAGRIGLSIPQALRVSSQQDLGPLTDELKRAIRQLSWGYPLDQIMNDLTRRIGTPTARRAFTLIAEASRAGGNVEEMIATLERHIAGMQLTLRERAAMMRPYISYAYIAFFVFLAIGVILLRSFFLPILEIQAQAPGGMFQLGMDYATTRRYFYHMSLMEAFIAGLVAGKMGEGSIFAGLKHVAVLLLATILTFGILI